MLSRCPTSRRRFRSFALSPAAADAGGGPVGRSVRFRAGGTLRTAFRIRRISPYDGTPALTDSAPLPSWDRETQLVQDPVALPHTDVAGQGCPLVLHKTERAADCSS